MSGDAGTPPSKRAFGLYLGAVSGLGAVLVALSYLAFRAGLVDFFDAFPQAPVQTVQTYPAVSLYLCLSFGGLFVLVALVVLFGARVNRVRPENGR
ncbi:hypothetical protein [Halovenus marina]|uniref:hypothetical protein n=1 Tax=Halovenus marina TaxID=3396621 RepID=UPI003F5581E9